jgi:hypothetical protein
MNLLFPIPSRSGSKGLPGKDLTPVDGIPMVGRAAWVACLATRPRGGRCGSCSTSQSAPDVWARSFAGAGGSITSKLRSGTLSMNSLPVSSLPDNVRH